MLVFVKKFFCVWRTYLPFHLVKNLHLGLTRHIYSMFSHLFDLSVLQFPFRLRLKKDVTMSALYFWCCFNRLWSQSIYSLMLPCIPYSPKRERQREVRSEGERARDRPYSGRKTWSKQRNHWYVSMSMVARSKPKTNEACHYLFCPTQRTCGSEILQISNTSQVTFDNQKDFARWSAPAICSENVK